jgi:prepilin-type N-terminal cleavage/methylation domain-containing protein
MFVYLRKRMKCQKGFTLVELMVVVAIIGVLASIAVPRYSTATSTAHGGKIQSDLMSLDTAIQMAIAQGHMVEEGQNISGDAVIVANMNKIPTPDCTNFRVGTIDYTDVENNASYTIIIEGTVPRAAITATASNNTIGPFTVERLGK